MAKVRLSQYFTKRFVEKVDKNGELVMVRELFRIHYNSAIPRSHRMLY